MTSVMATSINMIFNPFFIYYVAVVPNCMLRHGLELILHLFILKLFPYVALQQDTDKNNWLAR